MVRNAGSREGRDTGEEFDEGWLSLRLVPTVPPAETRASPSALTAGKERLTQVGNADTWNASGLAMITLRRAQMLGPRHFALPAVSGQLNGRSKSTARKLSTPP